MRIAVPFRGAGCRAASALAFCLLSLAAPAAAQDSWWSTPCRVLDVQSPAEMVRRCTAAVRAGRWSSDDFANAYINGGDEQLRLGDHRRAVANYSRALRLRPGHAETLFRRGNAFYAARDYRSALADYEASLRPNPRYVGYLIGRANARYMLHDYAGALADYSAAIEINPHDSAARIGRGNAFMVRHDPLRALADYDIALRYPSSDPHAFYARGAARMAQRDWDGALADFNRAYELNPNSAATLARRARVYAARGNRGWAAADFAEAERLARGDASALNSLCWNLLLAGEPPERARAHCDASLAIDPDDIDTLHTRALVSLRQGNFRDAWTRLHRAMRRDRANPELLYGRGLAALRLGREREGRADIARALAIEPGIGRVYAEDYGLPLSN
ncbi:MAG TPA: tetratricopeptide repeat protein [Allosphingosinicella sp.]|nr:tetratricopeptide repeat protein [Allosphingosinicella sp.]